MTLRCSCRTFSAIVFVTAEHQPLCEVIELLTLVGRRVNGPAQFGIVQIFQQEQRANDTTEFPERKVELVLCALRAQAVTLHSNPESRLFVFNLFPGFNCIGTALKSRIVALKPGRSSW
jgi:hypothetical protein